MGPSIHSFLSHGPYALFQDGELKTGITSIVTTPTFICPYLTNVNKLNNKI